MLYFWAKGILFNLVEIIGFKELLFAWLLFLDFNLGEAFFIILILLLVDLMLFKLFWDFSIFLFSILDKLLFFKFILLLLIFESSV